MGKRSRKKRRGKADTANLVNTPQDNDSVDIFDDKLVGELQDDLPDQEQVQLNQQIAALNIEEALDKQNKSAAGQVSESSNSQGQPPASAAPHLEMVGGVTPIPQAQNQQEQSSTSAVQQIQNTFSVQPPNAPQDQNFQRAAANQANKIKFTHLMETNSKEFTIQRINLGTQEGKDSRKAFYQTLMVEKGETHSGLSGQQVRGPDFKKVALDSTHEIFAGNGKGLIRQTKDRVAVTAVKKDLPNNEKVKLAIQQAKMFLENYDYEKHGAIVLEGKDKALCRMQYSLLLTYFSQPEISLPMITNKKGEQVQAKPEDMIDVRVNGIKKGILGDFYYRNKHTYSYFKQEKRKDLLEDLQHMREGQKEYKNKIINQRNDPTDEVSEEKQVNSPQVNPSAGP